MVGVQDLEEEIAELRHDVVPSSFRDPSGFVFVAEGVLYRQVNETYGPDYDRLIQSGLYKVLTDEGLLVRHEEVPVTTISAATGAHKVLLPQKIPFVSYPYEWCFGQLKAAALATLEIEKISLEYGLSLKDASAFNIQFLDGKPILIDTLSFEAYREGVPWVAYRQFCQHFLAPLALMALTDVRLQGLFKSFLDGIPLDLASRLLPKRSYLRFGLLVHVHLHARKQIQYSDKPASLSARNLSKIARLAIVDSLKSTVRKLEWMPSGTEWADYYTKTNYSSEALQSKHRLVSELVDMVNPTSVWDLGANTGAFSRSASDRGIPTISFDIDPAAVEVNYQQCVKENLKNQLPLVLDVTNPTPAIGWANEERTPLLARGPADLALALALVHHLAISNNVPLSKVASLFSRICRSLIIEFVPKSDSQVQRLLPSREDIFHEYDQASFERSFESFFKIQKRVVIAGTERVLYLMTRV